MGVAGMIIGGIVGGLLLGILFAVSLSFIIGIFASFVNISSLPVIATAIIWVVSVLLGIIIGGLLGGALIPV